MSKSVYEMVTERIIEEMEKGVCPWQKPWTGTPDGAYNRITKKPYSLLNQMLLGKSGEWASFKQWSDLGGHVKKDEKSSIAVFWKINTYTEQNEDLVAEIGSASILNMLGIETPKSFRNSAAYIKSWIEVLRNDVTFIISASSKAEKAVQYIMAE